MNSRSEQPYIGSGMVYRRWAHPALVESAGRPRVQHASGLDDVPLSAHKFRHTFTRTWLERGGEVTSLSRLMGHSSVKNTEIYLGDFQSRQAQMQQAKYSLVNDLRPPKTGHGQHRYRRKRHPPRDGDATPESGPA